MVQSLYQAVAAVFIAQAFGMNLDLGAQLMIVMTATLASIGAAAVPGARNGDVSDCAGTSRHSIGRISLNRRNG